MSETSKSKFRLDQLASIAEILSSIAVVLTVVFLFFEVRNNTQAVSLNNRLIVSNSDRELFISNPRLSFILAQIKETDTNDVSEGSRAFQERYSLSFSDADLWRRYQGHQWANLEAEFLHGLGGNRELVEAKIRGLLAAPDHRLFWETNTFFDPGFRSLVDSIFDEF